MFVDHRLLGKDLPAVLSVVPSLPLQAELGRLTSGDTGMWKGVTQILVWLLAQSLALAAFVLAWVLAGLGSLFNFD